ncbi:hypothetical protein A3D12_04380 [Candidatus Peribacteria bacterium RIFCSPHIGHO2_02_FULL_55_24]|nr:MAG: hypothetical protein A3D12_04380 [Candidatus Peribacteria bacterium RIFCSPHIGHO2_02_FULL_55_24]
MRFLDGSDNEDPIGDLCHGYGLIARVVGATSKIVGAPTKKKNTTPRWNGGADLLQESNMVVWCVVVTAVVASAIALWVGVGIGYADGWERGRASYWSTVASLPIGERMHCYGCFKMENGWIGAVTDDQKVSLWFIRTEQELPKRFVLLIEEGERKITELP